MGKRVESLLFKFGIIFGAFTFVVLAMCVFALYGTQTHSYKEEREKSIQQVASYLEKVLTADGEDFLWYQSYFIQHADTLLIPHDFTAVDIPLARSRFERLFATQYPGQVLGVTIGFDALSEEVKEAYTVYKHQYYLDQFEQARVRFDLMYVEYIVPNAQTMSVAYVLDSMRDVREVDSKDYIELAITVDYPREAHEKLWQAWETGLSPEGYDRFDNEFGKTYAYYAPLHIGARKLGLIGVEVGIASVNKAILRNTLHQTANIAVILVLCVAGMLLLIYNRYISKLEHLQKSIREYAQKKDVSIAVEIEKNASGKDEISMLALQASSMIMELENYMKSLLSTSRQLKDSQQQAAFMSELASKDALTGIRNKVAYDKDVARLDWQIADGTAQFGIAMVDLNFLKRINDNYGHEMGNNAIKKLCYDICHMFEHSPVFRIGGDEFAVILEKTDYEQADFLVQAFISQVEDQAQDKTLEPWERVTAAIGYALYDPEIDTNVANVFRRADRAMYACKKEMKAVREV